MSKYLFLGGPYHRKNINVYGDYDTYKANIIDNKDYEIFLLDSLLNIQHSTHIYIKTKIYERMPANEYLRFSTSYMMPKVIEFYRCENISIDDSIKMYQCYQEYKKRKKNLDKISRLRRIYEKNKY